MKHEKQNKELPIETQMKLYINAWNSLGIDIN